MPRAQDASMRRAKESGGPSPWQSATDKRPRQPSTTGDMAIFESFAGNRLQAQRAATNALKLSDGRDSTYAAAFALARLGDRARAVELAEELQRRFPEDTSVRLGFRADVARDGRSTVRPPRTRDHHSRRGAAVQSWPFLRWRSWMFIGVFSIRHSYAARRI